MGFLYSQAYVVALESFASTLLSAGAYPFTDRQVIKIRRMDGIEKAASEVHDDNVLLAPIPMNWSPTDPAAAQDSKASCTFIGRDSTHISLLTIDNFQKRIFPLPCRFSRSTILLWATGNKKEIEMPAAMATKALIENQLAKCAVDAKFDVLFVNRSGANFGTKYDIVEADALEFNLGFTADVATARDLAFHFEKALDPVLSAAQTFPFDVELYAEVPGPLRSAVANAIEDFRRTNP